MFQVYEEEQTIEDKRRQTGRDSDRSPEWRQWPNEKYLGYNAYMIHIAHIEIKCT